jgi:hypothetical protein
VRIFTTFEGGDGPDGRGTESRKQTKQKNDEENEPGAEEKHTPVGGKSEVRRVVGGIDEAEHKRRRPRRKECAKDGGKEREQRALAKDELDEAPTAGADRDSESHLLGASGGLGGHISFSGSNLSGAGNRDFDDGSLLSGAINIP